MPNHNLRIIFHSFLYQFQVQGKDPSVDFTQDIVEESEDERCFDEISDSVPTIDLPPCEIGKLEEISELVSSCLPSPVRREKLASAIENEGNFIYLLKVLNEIICKLSRHKVILFPKHGLLSYLRH